MQSGTYIHNELSEGVKQKRVLNCLYLSLIELVTNEFLDKQQIAF